MGNGAGERDGCMRILRGGERMGSGAGERDGAVTRLNDHLEYAFG